MLMSFDDVTLQLGPILPSARPWPKNFENFGKLVKMNKKTQDKFFFAEMLRRIARLFLANKKNYVSLAYFLTPLFYIFILFILLRLCFIFKLMQKFLSSLLA